ncbi:hypothetical protein EU519_01440 [Candidatus Thorarchaeota archaeon]|nr:MAG: hypothetical protein EU519_01440 [Candidatus Thorarchaeota archaeon]
MRAGINESDCRLVASIQVEIDTSLLDDLLSYVQHTDRGTLDRIIQHPAALKTYKHAVRFENTSKDIRGFWSDVLDVESEQRSQVVKAVDRCLDHLRSERETYQMLFKDLRMYLPDDCILETTLYAIIGYDVGIVSDGSALLNLAHPWFQEDIREVPFLAMHELHHVAYTSYNPMFKMADLQTTSDLFEAVRYATHMEGLAVYAPLERRIDFEVFSNIDYPVLLNRRVRDKRVREYFSMVEELEAAEERPLDSSDLEVIEVMSGGKTRLWYIAGAHMAMAIDENLGRESLVQTIVDGPAAFFDVYSTLA